MMKPLWLVSAVLAIFVLGICIQTGLPDSGTRLNATASVPVATVAESQALHDMPAAAIAAEYIRHNNNVTAYSATIQTAGISAFDDGEYRFYAVRPVRFRAEYIRSAIHGNGTTVVANGTFVWQYHPDTGTAEPGLIEDPANTFFAGKDYPAIAARILEHSKAVLNGTENLNGSPAVVLEAAVEGIPTQYYPALFTRIRLWIDEDTLTMARMELIGDYNETELSVDLTNISLDSRLPDELFDFVPPPGTVVSPTIAELVAPTNLSSMRQAKERFGPEFRVPSDLPAGYRCRYCLHYRNSDGRDSIVYSSGTDDLVFTQAMEKNNASFAVPAGPVTALRIGNSPGTFWQESGTNFIRWSCGNKTYELSGTATKDDMTRIAQSLEPPRLLNFAPDEIENPETIAEIALRDTSARRMVDAGGEIMGVEMAVMRGTKNGDGGIFPALLIRYNGLSVDFMVDPVSGTAAGRTVQVPNGAIVSHEANRTVVRYNGELLFTFDPMEENQ